MLFLKIANVKCADKKHTLNLKLFVTHICIHKFSMKTGEKLNSNRINSRLQMQRLKIAMSNQVMPTELEIAAISIRTSRGVRVRRCENGKATRVLQLFSRILLLQGLQWRLVGKWPIMRQNGLRGPRLKSAWYLAAIGAVRPSEMIARVEWVSDWWLIDRHAARASSLGRKLKFGLSRRRRARLLPLVSDFGAPVFLCRPHRIIFLITRAG